MESSSKQVYTYIAVKDGIFQRVQKSYGYYVINSVMDLEEYDMEGERATSITSLETDLNTKETNHIGM